MVEEGIAAPRFTCYTVPGPRKKAYLTRESFASGGPVIDPSYFPPVSILTPPPDSSSAPAAGVLEESAGFPDDAVRVDAVPLRPFSMKWLLLLVIFSSSLGLFASHGDFAFFYHPDESGKVKQVLSGHRNFRHPLLMLSVSNVVAKVSGLSKNPQSVVRAGRISSALFAALTVTLAAAMAWEMAGTAWAALPVVAAVGISRELFEFAHYMKEDAALALGWMAVFYTARRNLARCTRENLAGLAIATATAISAKYIGVLALLVALPIIFFVARRQHSTRELLLWFGLPLAVALAVFNYSVFDHPKGVFNALHREVGIATHGHRGVPHPIPHSYYLELLFNDTPMLVVGLTAVYLLLLAFRRRESARGEWLLPAFTVAYTILLSCTPIVSRRYFLPAYVMVTLMAGLGAWRLASLVAGLGGRRWLAPVAAILLAAGIASASAPAVFRTWQSFGQDDHLALAAWMRTHLPATAVIAQDDRVNLPHPGRWEYEQLTPVPQEIRAKEFVCDLDLTGSAAKAAAAGESADEAPAGPAGKTARKPDTVDEMVASGIGYVAVCNQTYDRFFDATLKPRPEVADWYAGHRAFYADLQQRGQLVWSSAKGAVTYTQPGLSLYRIDQLAPSPAPAR